MSILTSSEWRRITKLQKLFKNISTCQYLMYNFCHPFKARNFSISGKYCSLERSRKSLDNENLYLYLDNQLKFKNAPVAAKKIFHPPIKYCRINRIKQTQHYSTDTNGGDGKTTKVDSHTARCIYAGEIESAINDQIVTEFRAGASFFMAACYFGRSDVGLFGTQNFFMKMFAEEQTHGMLLINYQLERGGGVKLDHIMAHDGANWNSITKALEVTLEVEKKIAAKFDDIIHLAVKFNDKRTADFITKKFLAEQYSAIRQIGKLFTRSQLMSSSAVEEYLFDTEMSNAFGHASIKI